jgi:hypothetical protein
MNTMEFGFGRLEFVLVVNVVGRCAFSRALAAAVLLLLLPLH